MDGSDGALIGSGAFILIMACTCCMLVLFIAMIVAVHYLVYQAAAGVPKAFRKVEPVSVWLLLIPFFGLFWNFIVFPQVSASYKAYFASLGRQDEVGDCGEAMGWAYAILIAAAFLISPSGFIIAPLICGISILPLAALIFLVIWLMKTFELKKKIEAMSPQPETLPPAEVL